jgi:hypothetical protein
MPRNPRRVDKNLWVIRLEKSSHGCGTVLDLHQLPPLKSLLQYQVVDEV